MQVLQMPLLTVRFFFLYFKMAFITVDYLCIDSEEDEIKWLG